MQSHASLHTLHHGPKPGAASPSLGRTQPLRGPPPRHTTYSMTRASAPQRRFRRPTAAALYGFLLALATHISCGRDPVASSPWMAALDRSFVPTPPRALAAFDLVDHNRRPFSRSNLRGQWSWVFFGCHILSRRLPHHPLHRRLGAQATEGYGGTAPATGVCLCRSTA